MRQLLAIAFAAMLVATFALTGCGGSSGDAGGDKGSAPEAMDATGVPDAGSSKNAGNVASDTANIRSGLALAQAEYLTSGASSDMTYYLNSDGTVTEIAPGTFVTTGDNPNGVTIGDNTGLTWHAGERVTYKIDSMAGTTKIVVGN